MSALIPTHQVFLDANNLSLLRSLYRSGVLVQAWRAQYRPSVKRARASSGPKPDGRSVHRYFSSFSSSSSSSSSNDTHDGDSVAQSSVSPVQVSHFSRLASSWWDPHGPSRLLHLMNPLRHAFIASCLSSVIRPPPSSTNKLTYLDIGCGGGIFAESAARLPSTQTVTGVDPTPSVLAVAKDHQRTDPALAPPKLTYLNVAVEHLPALEQADIVTLFEVLEHIDYPSAFLDRCIAHVKPGGWIIGSTIARSPLSYLTTKIIAEAPLVGVVPRGTHDWDKYINPAELEGWFEKRERGKREGGGGERWGKMRRQGVIYVPALGWRMVDGTEGLGNYFFGVQRLLH